MNSIAIRFKRHYLPLTILSLISSLILFLIWNKLDAITYTAKSTGYISLILLAASLMIGTINLVLKRNNPLSSYFRRDLGIFGGFLAVVHSVSGLFVHMRGNMWTYFLNQTEQGFTIRLDHFGIANYTGLISAILILVLIISSNDYSIKKLNPANWKNLQRITYLMFAIVLVHSVYYLGDQLSRLYYLYLPVLGIILVFQFIGIGLRMQNK